MPYAAGLNESDGEWRCWDLVDGDHVERELPEIDGGWSPSGYFEGAVENIVGLLDRPLRDVTVRS